MGQDLAGVEGGGRCVTVCVTLQADSYLTGPKLPLTKAPKYLWCTLAAISVNLIK